MQNHTFTYSFSSFLGPLSPFYGGGCFSLWYSFLKLTCKQGFGASGVREALRQLVIDFMARASAKAMLVCMFIKQTLSLS